MDDSLQSQSQRVIDYILRYMDFVYGLIERSGIKRTALGRAMLEQAVDPLAPTERIRAAAGGAATEEEKKHEYFAILMSQNAVDRFSAELLKQFPDVDFNKLARLNAITTPVFSHLDLHNLSGMAFMIMGGMMQFVPRLLDRSLRFDAVAFLFYITGVLIIYPRWAKHGLKRKIHQRAMYVLEYTAIVSSDRP